MDASGPDLTLGELSEGEILRAIFARTSPSDSAVVGPGDDAAVLSLSSPQMVITTDTLIEGPDFRRAWSSGYDLGWKSAAVNLADIAAMGAMPTGLVVALAVTTCLRLSWVAAFTDGVREACEALAPGCAVVGGDLATAPVVTIAVTAFGELGDLSPVRRGGASVGEVVAVAGELGQASRGLEVLFTRFHNEQGAISVDFSQLDDDETLAVSRQLRPQPPIALGVVAARAGATAMMDVSDGFALDASRLAEASDISINVESSRLGEYPLTALLGGEDHALLATFPLGQLPEGFRAIGVTRPRGTHHVMLDNEPVDPQGWDPYRDG